MAETIGGGEGELNALPHEDSIAFEDRCSNAFTSFLRWARSRKTVFTWIVTHEKSRIAMLRWVALVLGFRYPFSVVAIVS
jgi:hypothetical protein